MDKGRDDGANMQKREHRQDTEGNVECNSMTRKRRPQQNCGPNHIWPHMHHFPPLQHALRAVAQSLAREHGPSGVHVAHIVVDGLIEGERTASFGAPPELLMGTKHIADAYYAVHAQHKSAWTFELDLRPNVEKW